MFNSGTYSWIFYTSGIILIHCPLCFNSPQEFSVFYIHQKHLNVQLCCNINPKFIHHVWHASKGTMLQGNSVQKILSQYRQLTGTTMKQNCRDFCTIQEHKKNFWIRSGIKTMAYNLCRTLHDQTERKWLQIKQDRQCMYNIMLKCIHATIVAVDKQ